MGNRRYQSRFLMAGLSTGESWGEKEIDLSRGYGQQTTGATRRKPPQSGMNFVKGKTTTRRLIGIFQHAILKYENLGPVGPIPSERDWHLGSNRTEKNFMKIFGGKNLSVRGINWSIAKRTEYLGIKGTGRTYSHK